MKIIKEDRDFDLWDKSSDKTPYRIKTGEYSAAQPAILRYCGSLNDLEKNVRLYFEKHGKDSTIKDNPGRFVSGDESIGIDMQGKLNYMNPAKIYPDLKRFNFNSFYKLEDALKAIDALRAKENTVTESKHMKIEKITEAKKYMKIEKIDESFGWPEDPRDDVDSEKHEKEAAARAKDDNKELPFDESLDEASSHQERIDHINAVGDRLAAKYNKPMRKKDFIDAIINEIYNSPDAKETIRKILNGFRWEEISYALDQYCNYDEDAKMKLLNKVRKTNESDNKDDDEDEDKNGLALDYLRDKLKANDEFRKKNGFTNK